MSNNTNIKVTKRDEKKKKRRDRRNNFQTGLTGIRTSLKIVSLISIIMGGALPVLFWNIYEPTPENPLTTTQTWTFITLVVSGLINFIYGLISFLWALNKTDQWFLTSKKTFATSSFLLVFGGAFLLGMQYLYIWWRIRKIDNNKERQE